MNAFQQFRIKNGSALIAGDDDTDNRAYIELAQVSLWQAADFLNKVEDSSKCRFEEEINSLGTISDSLLGKYEATPKNLYTEDWAAVIVPMVKNWLGSAPDRNLVLQAGSDGRIVARLEPGEGAGKPDFEAHPVNEHVDDAATLEDTRDALGLARAMGSLLQLAGSSASNYKLLGNAEAKRDELEAELRAVIKTLGDDSGAGEIPTEKSEAIGEQALDPDAKKQAFEEMHTARVAVRRSRVYLDCVGSTLPAGIKNVLGLEDCYEDACGLENVMKSILQKIDGCPVNKTV